MKKQLITFVVLLICLGTSTIYAVADSSKVEISFKVGDDVLKINGKDVKVQKPYVENGATLVPLAVITQAFGADVKWSAADSSITITYGDTVIKLVVNKKTATVNGKQSTLLKAPVVKNNVTMVPLTFISENFGADVKYDGKTKQINVTKVIAGDKSIKDFSLILKKTTKSKIGDSYYKWSMNLPKGLKISDRSFDGTSTTFEALDETYNINISIFDKEDDTLDSLMADLRERFSDYTLVSQDKGNKDNIESSKTVFKSDEGVIDIRFYIKDGKILKTVLFVNDYDQYKDSTVYTDVADSFSTDYVKNNSIEDLSDINKDGFRTYEDKKLKFSVNVLPEWYKMEDKKSSNSVEFDHITNSKDEYYDSFYVNMYSTESSFTADDWVKKLLKDMEDNIHPDYYKVLKQEDSTINGIPCKKVYYTEKIGTIETYSCDVFIVGKKYRYNVFYHIKSETHNDTAKFEEIEKALNSFKFTEPDASKIGTLMDPKDAENSDSTAKRKNSQYKWAVDLPVSWTADSSNNDKDSISYSANSGRFAMTVMNGVSVADFTSLVDDDIAKKIKLGTYKTSNKEKLNDKGTEVYKYTTIQVVGKLNVKVDTYILCKNEYLYAIDISSPEYFLSEKNKEKLDSIWQSMKFE